MDRRHFEFLEVMQQVDDKWILEAGEPWKIKKTVDEKKEYVRFAVTAKAACILLVLVLGVSCIFHEQVKAAITQALTRIGQWMGNENDLSPYVEEVMQSQTIDGITVHLKEILLGKDKVTAYVSLEGYHASREESMISINEVRINGEYIDCIAGDTYAEESEDEFVMEYFCEKGAIPEGIQKVEFVIGYYEKVGKEYWETSENFKFTVFPEKSGAGMDFSEQNLDIDMEDEDGQLFHLKEYTYNKVEGQIRVLCDKDPREYESEEMEFYDLPYRIDIVDDKGNECGFEPIFYDEEKGEIWFESEFGTQPWEKSKYIDVYLYADTISYDGIARPSRLVGEKRIELGEKGEKE